MLTIKIHQSGVDVHYLEMQGVDIKTLQELQTQGVDIKSIEDTFRAVEKLFAERDDLYKEIIKKKKEAEARLRNRGWEL